MLDLGRIQKELKEIEKVRRLGWVWRVPWGHMGAWWVGTSPPHTRHGRCDHRTCSFHATPGQPCAHVVNTPLTHLTPCRCPPHATPTPHRNPTCAQDKVSGVTVQVRDNNVQRLLGFVPGPKDTPYDGGLYQIEINLPDQYPFVPPKMRFVTKVWHPNISSQSGAICLDILKDQWSPALTLKTALLSLQALLSSPQPDDPQDAVVAKQYLSEYDTYCKTAKYWTEAFANPHTAAPEEKIKSIVEMGFARADAIAALQATGGDENAALEKLLGG